MVSHGVGHLFSPHDRASLSVANVDSPACRTVYFGLTRELDCTFVLDLGDSLVGCEVFAEIPVQ
jgi:hypothetical protein